MVSARRTKPCGLMEIGLSSRSHLVHNLDVVVEDGCDDGHHIGFDDPCPDILRSPHADVEDALERQVPLPHVHHVLAAALLEDAYQALDAAIDGEDVAYACGGCGEVGEVVERVDEREGGGAVEGAAVVEGGGDAHRGLVGVRDAEVYLAHVCSCLVPSQRGWGVAGWSVAGLVSHVVGSKQSNLAAASVVQTAGLGVRVRAASLVSCCDVHATRGPCVRVKDGEAALRASNVVPARRTRGCKGPDRLVTRIAAGLGRYEASRMQRSEKGRRGRLL